MKKVFAGLAAGLLILFLCDSAMAQRERPSREKFESNAERTQIRRNLQNASPRTDEQPPPTVVGPPPATDRFPTAPAFGRP